MLTLLQGDVKSDQMINVNCQQKREHKYTLYYLQ